jgi:hypothetical protein
MALVPTNLFIIIGSSMHVTSQGRFVRPYCLFPACHKPRPFSSSLSLRCMALVQIDLFVLISFSQEYKLYKLYKPNITIWISSHGSMCLWYLQSQTISVPMFLIARKFKLVQETMLITYIRYASGSSQGKNTEYPTEIFVILLSAPRKMWGNVFQLRPSPSTSL